MVKVLVECAAHGIVALPLHDGVLVPDSRASDAEAIMHRAFFDGTGGFLAKVGEPRAADGEGDTAQMPGAPLFEDAEGE